MLARLGMSAYLPRTGQFIALPRLKDWLKLLSFEVNRGRFGCRGGRDTCGSRKRP